MNNFAILLDSLFFLLDTLLYINENEVHIEC